MAVVLEKEKSFSNIDDEEDALLNEAICCSRNLEIKTDDDDDEVNNTNNKEKNMENQKQNISNGVWCDMDSDLSGSSTSNGNVDLSTSGGKINLSVSNIKSDDLKASETNEAQNGKDTQGAENAMYTDDPENISPTRKRIRENDTESEMKSSRNRRNSTSSSSTLSSTTKPNPEYETDPGTLARRQKDIDYGKNTIGYDRYIQAIPKEQRTKDHPRTPPMYTKYSRRGWDGMVKLWRKQLHFWDPEDENNKTQEDLKNDMKNEDIES